MPIAPSHLITDSEELLHRNAHPMFVHEGRPSSQVFSLKTADRGALSTQRNSKASPQVAYERYTARGLASAGIWSITVLECDELNLSAYDDPVADDDSHAIIDLTACPASQARRLTDKLAAKARSRGCQYSTSSTVETLRPES